MGTPQGSLSQSERHLYYMVGYPENGNMYKVLHYSLHNRNDVNKQG